jgi:hypothetical protein
MPRLSLSRFSAFPPYFDADIAINGNGENTKIKNKKNRPFNLLERMQGIHCWVAFTR